MPASSTFNTSGTPYQFAWADAQQTADRNAQQKLAETQGGFGLKESQIQANASMFPSVLKNQRFNQIFPWLQGQFAQLTPRLGGAPGGQSGQGPQISTNPIWGQDQLQQQINSSRAQTDASTAAHLRDVNQSIAGRGFGANSPLAAALGANYQMAGQAQNSDNDRNFRLAAGQANAGHLLSAQQAGEQQFANRMQEDIERRKTAASTFNAFLASLGGMV